MVKGYVIYTIPLGEAGGLMAYILTATSDNWHPQGVPMLSGVVQDSLGEQSTSWTFYAEEAFIFESPCKETMDLVHHQFREIKHYTYQYEEVPDSADGAV